MYINITTTDYQQGAATPIPVVFSFVAKSIYRTRF